MKILLLFHISLMLFYSCTLVTSKNELEAFIPGTYIRLSVHEYGTEYDTLVITLQNQSAHEYKILRKWKYERVIDGVPIEPEYKRQSTTGIYKNNQKVIQEMESGELYSFDVKDKALFNGSTKYQKL